MIILPSCSLTELSATTLYTLSVGSFSPQLPDPMVMLPVVWSTGQVASDCGVIAKADCETDTLARPLAGAASSDCEKAEGQRPSVETVGPVWPGWLLWSPEQATTASRANTIRQKRDHHGTQIPYRCDSIPSPPIRPATGDPCGCQ